jgi:hypothetical protein
VGAIKLRDFWGQQIFNCAVACKAYFAGAAFRFDAELSRQVAVRAHDNSQDFQTDARFLFKI